MKLKKFLSYIILSFVVAYLCLPFTLSFATENKPTVNAPVALIMDSRNW